MNAIQLELDFRSAHSWCEAFAQALAEPEVADLRQLWRSLEPELLGLTEKEQLSVAGQALCDLAEVCQRRAEMMWGEWVDQHNTDGPIPDEDFLEGLVQKSMFLDISSLVRQPKSRRVAVAAVEDEGESVVEEVTKEVALLLAAVDEAESEEAILGLEYDEDITAWAEAIRGWLKQQGLESAEIVQLQHETGLSLVKLWLAGLLGGFELEQCGGFYEVESIVFVRFSV